jgi:hypothetical protein
MRLIGTAAAAILGATVATGAMDLALDQPAVDAAIRLGQSRIERDRTTFHAAYRLVLDKAPADYVDIVTPFRRVVLAAETQALVGDRTFGLRQGLELAAVSGAQVDLRAEFTFHPLNTYVGVPDYSIRLLGRETVVAEAQERIPRFGARVDGPQLSLPAPGGRLRGETQPMLGGTVVARFDGERLDPRGTYDVVIAEGGKELARGRVDFGKLR